MTPNQVFDDLYRRHRVDLRNFINRRVGNWAIAEDLAGDVWVKAYRAVTGGSWRDDNPWAWLQMAARHRLADHWMYGFHHREVPDQDTVTTDRPDDRATPDAVALRRAESQALVAAIGRLPSRQQRECIQLRYFAGLDRRDVADRLGIGVWTVADHLDRAKAALARDMDLRRTVGAPPIEARQVQGRAWTDPNRLRGHYPTVAALTAAGLTARAVADRLGLTVAQVEGIRKRVRRSALREVAA
jgi:RNA polymerase sigma-70 factor (ECF subfamily)